MNDDNKVRECKKCHRILPEGYKHKYCGACRNKQAENSKKIIGFAGGAAACLTGIVRIFLNKKIGSDK